MAGSYHHVVDKGTGKLLRAEPLLSMLDCYHGDVYEAVEEMYGMIWWLADTLSELSVAGTPAEFVESARENYRTGLTLSPGTDGDLSYREV